MDENLEGRVADGANNETEILKYGNDVLGHRSIYCCPTIGSDAWHRLVTYSLTMKGSSVVGR